MTWSGRAKEVGYVAFSDLSLSGLSCLQAERPRTLPGRELEKSGTSE